MDTTRRCLSYFLNTTFDNNYLEMHYSLNISDLVHVPICKSFT